MRAITLAAALVLLTCSLTQAETYLVEPDGTGDFPTIRAAVVAAIDGDIIELGDGTFTGDDNKDIAYLGKAITIKSQSGDPAACIIDCAGLGRGFAFDAGEGTSSVLDGVTVRNGSMPGLYGGAIHLGVNSVPEIRHCIFLGNSASVGGALMGEEGAAPMILNCRFEGNVASGGGGAGFRETARPSFIDCEFVDNSAHWGGGIGHARWTAAESAGGGEPLPAPEPAAGARGDGRSLLLTVQGCRFHQNQSEWYEGGGIYLWWGRLLLENSSFTRNGGDGWADGGSGLRISGDLAAPSQIRGCTFADNWSDEDGGGGIYIDWGGSLQIENSLFANNRDNAILVEDCDATVLALSCCDIYGHDGEDWIDCYADQYGVNGNITADPRFCDPAGFDYRVDATSPCLPAGNACGVLIGALGKGCAIYGNVYQVSPDGAGDFPTIQSAIDACINYDVIELAGGVFTGAGNWDLDYQGKPITIRSASGDPAACIIDCAGLPHRGFYFQHQETREAVLEGLTITGGNVLSIGQHGGAILCGSADPTIRNCVIIGNQAKRGAGLALFESSPLIENCSIVGNALGVAEQYGAGLYCYRSNPQLVKTIIAYNAGGPGVDMFLTPQPTFACCTLYGNSGGDWSADIEHWLGTAGNVARDPLFCDLAGGDLHLDADSPCLAGSSDCGEAVGALGQGCDLPTARIAGQIRDTSGAPLAGVRVTAGLYDFQNGADGAYRLDVRLFWSGTVQPFLAGFLFTPRERSYSGGMGDYLADDYSGRRATHVRVPDDLATIQAGIDNCLAGDTVQVAAGTYTGAGNKNLEITGRDLVIIGAGPEATRIDCEHDGRGLFIHDGVSAACLVQGLSIANAYAATSGSAGGGGLRVVAATPTLRDLLLVGCQSSTWGGGLYLANTSGLIAQDLRIESCTAGEHGGGLALSAATATFDRLALWDNHAEHDGGGVYASGGAPVFTQLSAVANSAGWGGGGIGGDGATALNLANAVIALNTAASGGLFLRDAGSTVALACCDVWGNEGGNYGGAASDQTGANGNISADPVFCEWETGDLTLAPLSPCLPAGNACGVQMGAYGLGCTTAFVTISGRVLDPGGQPLAAVRLDGPLVPPVTDGTGAYTLTVPAGWSGYLRPFKLGHVFVPPQRDYAELTGNQADQDFVGRRSTLHRVPADHFSLGLAFTTVLEGDTILVAPGTYTGAVNRNLDFAGRELVVKSQSGSDSTVIDCEQDGRAFVLNNQEWSGAVIEGFTIQNGLIASGDDLGPNGGGIYIRDASPTLRDLILSNNTSVYGKGGGIYCEYSFSPMESLRFIANQAGSGDGGGLACIEGGPQLSDVLFAANSAQDEGGGFYCLNAAPTLTRATFHWNQSAGGAAAIHAAGSAAPLLIQVLITGSLTSPAIACGAATPMFACSDIWGNDGGDWTGCIADQLGANGNLTADPRYCAPNAWDFHLASDSPCLPAHSTCGVQIGAFGEGCTLPTATPEAEAVPAASFLNQNVPNPFNPWTQICFGLAAPAEVSLTIFDASGRRVRRLLVGERREAGYHSAIWRGEDEVGRALPSGVYFYRLEAGTFHDQRKMLLLR